LSSTYFHELDAKKILTQMALKMVYSKSEFAYARGKRCGRGGGPAFSQVKGIF
jgi:hypothetical protein